ncbi:gamma-glutamylcyclotransferase family protein [Sandaracinus amylolyticus]|uniref:gamma-glutamylcyclotransferase family protein n=1 Tax=Sandaracinus amylolyticus TaxID=927083 RepID=UPI001F2AD32A|nr:gamma-glutamylcyclotransferase family protein [Sandaracinus amylolyticus]
MEHRVFVYGTLRRDHPNHGVIARARFDGPARGGDEVIEGELYTVDDALLAELDRFEDVPRLYRRERVVLEDGSEAEVYVAARVG